MERRVGAVLLLCLGSRPVQAHGPDTRLWPPGAAVPAVASGTHFPTTHTPTTRRQFRVAGVPVWRSAAFSEGGRRALAGRAGNTSVGETTDRPSSQLLPSRKILPDESLPVNKLSPHISTICGQVTSLHRNRLGKYWRFHYIRYLFAFARPPRDRPLHIVSVLPLTPENSRAQDRIDD